MAAEEARVLETGDPSGCTGRQQSQAPEIHSVAKLSLQRAGVPEEVGSLTGQEP